MSTIRATALMHQFVPGATAPRPPSLKRRAVALAFPLLVTGGLALAACGSDGDTATTKPTTTAAPAKVVETSTTVADDGTVTVHAVDFNYEDLPEAVPAGTTFKLVNDAEEELHEFVAFRLPDDEHRSADDLIALPQAELEAVFGGPPATVLLAKPGGPQIEAVGDGTLTEPGRYLVACSIPVGADPDEVLASDGPPPADAGVPHFHHGMYAEITVT